MSLSHWQPLRELSHLRQQINQLFDDLLHRERSMHQISQWQESVWGPAIELNETNTDVILKAQIPGIDAKDLDVEVRGDAVTIAGHYQAEKQHEEQGMFHSEFHYGQFQRLVPLPVTIDHEQVKAEFDKGILTLTLPKLEPNRRQSVRIDLSEKVREGATQQRQHDEHLQQTAHTRAASMAPDRTETGEDLREATTEQRQHDEHLQQTAHTRAEAEIDTTP